MPPSSDRYRTLFDALADPALVYPLGPDGPGPIVAFNRAAVDLYGYDAATLATKTIGDLLASGGTPIAEALDELRRNRQATFDSVHRTADGRRLPVQTSARLVEVDGQLCVLSVARDDSDRRAFQRELSRANLGLERTVAARTAELQAFADALKILHGITTADFATPHDRTDAYLRAGCAMFGLPVGILSATPLDPDTGERLYRLDAVISPDPSLTPGLTVPISEAFCDAVLERGDTVVYADAAADEATACHPAFATRGLRAFIGTPIRIDGEIVGTLNFVSPEPRATGFRAFERDLVEIMADAVARRVVVDRAERQRRDTETYYRAVVDTVEEGIVTLDAGGRVTMSNPSARRLLGLAPEARDDGEPADAARWAVVDEDGEPVAPENLPERRVLATGEAVRGALQGVVHPSGTVRWYRVNAAPVDHDGDGLPEAVVLSFADVTDLREAQQTLARRSRLRRDTVRLARVGGWSWDVATDRVEWSPELYTLLGVAEGSLDPSLAGYLALVALEDRASVAATIESALAPGSDGLFSMGHGVVTAGGATRLLCHGEVIRDADGAAVRVVGAAQALDDLPLA